MQFAGFVSLPLMALLRRHSQHRSSSFPQPPLPPSASPFVPSSSSPASSPPALSALSQSIFFPRSLNFSRTVSLHTSLGYRSLSDARRALEQPSPFADDERMQLLFEAFLSAQCGEGSDWYETIFGQVQEFGGNNERFMREVGRGEQGGGIASEGVE